MTSLKLLDIKGTTFGWASVTKNCAKIFDSRKDAEKYDYDCVDGFVHVVAAHNPHNLNLEKTEETCSFCEEQIAAWCIVRYIRVRFPDQNDRDYANYCKSGATNVPVADERPWQKDFSCGGTYIKDKHITGIRKMDANNVGDVVCDIIIFKTMCEAVAKAKQMEKDNCEFCQTFILPCHNDEIDEEE